MTSSRRTLAVALAALLGPLFVVIAPSQARDRIGQEVTVSGHQGIAPVVATDAHGRATAVWLEQDRVDDTGLPDNTLWRVRTGTLAAGERAWVRGPFLSTTGAVRTHPLDGEGPSPRIAIASAPSGATAIAWVQTVAGAKRVQYAFSPGFARPFRAVVTLPADTQCAVLSDILRLGLVLDAAGGALTYLDSCGSGAAYRRAAVISSGGTVGTPYTVAQTAKQASLIRSGGTTTLVSYESFFTGKLTAYELGRSQVTASRVLVNETTAGVNGYDVARTSQGHLASAMSLSVAGSNKIVVDVNNGNAPDTPTDRTTFDPVLDTAPFSPVVDAGLDGTLAVAWLEGGSVWVATRYRGDEWSTPRTLSDPADGGMVQDSVDVDVSPTGAAHVAWNTQVNTSGVVQFTGWAAVRAGRTATVPDPHWTPSYRVHLGSVFPDLAVHEDGTAVSVVTRFSANRPEILAARIEAPEDDVRPTISGATLSRTRFSPGSPVNGVALKRGRKSVAGVTYTSDLKKGVTLRFTQSEWGRTQLTVKHVGCASTKLVGRPKEKLVRCDPRRLAGVVYSTTFEAVAAVRGPTTYAYTGAVARGRSLAAGGTYQLSLTAIDASGLRSTRSASFKVTVDGAPR